MIDKLIDAADLWDDEELHLPDACPNCGHHYDEIDYEYQICHICKFNNNGKKEESGDL